MTDEMRFLCGDILKYYGEEHQQEKAIEEMGELISAIKHNDRAKYIEELADTGVMLEQLVQALSFEENAEYIKVQYFKILRQKERISVEQAFRNGFEEGKKNANT